MPTLEENARTRAAAVEAAKKAIRDDIGNLDATAVDAAAQHIVDHLYQLRQRRGLAAVRTLTNSVKVSNFRHKEVERAPGKPSAPLGHYAFFSAVFAARTVIVEANERG
ncbi:hypothetical protein [Micromonospora sp. NPDC005174]|uniref:hypothetical protein n=1 Tax=Micromonospora sp. NPDC005174 TaxID=3157018 RepID=UPI0033A54190